MFVTTYKLRLPNNHTCLLFRFEMYAHAGELTNFILKWTCLFFFFIKTGLLSLQNTQTLQMLNRKSKPDCGCCIQMEISGEKCFTYLYCQTLQLCTLQQEIWWIHVSCVSQFSEQTTIFWVCVTPRHVTWLHGHVGWTKWRWWFKVDYSQLSISVSCIWKTRFHIQFIINLKVCYYQRCQIM